jgi:hypothetical protein
MTQDDTHDPRRRVRLAARVAAAATAALALGAMSTFPRAADLPPGWSTPIIAFEFARAADDLAWLSGPGAEGLRRAMDAGHLVDAFFPFAYGLLLFFTARGLSGRASRVGQVTALLAIGLDHLENHALTSITSILDAAADPTPLIPLLIAATWAKWSTITATFAALALGIRRDERLTAAALALGPLALPVAALTHDPAIIEAFTKTITIGFVALIVRGLRGK